MESVKVGKTNDCARGTYECSGVVTADRELQLYLS